MLSLQAPALIRVREDITVNLNTCVSQQVLRKAPIRQLKKSAAARVRQEGGVATAEDYEVVGQADTVSFFFIGGTSLTYRVGEEITQEDFDHVATIITNLQYRMKNDGVSSHDKVGRKT